MITKDFILEEIRRITEENGGSPPGRQKFFSETGIKESDWYGKYWTKWGAALKEAGYTPNRLQEAYDDEWLLEQFVLLIKELGRFPVSGDLRVKAWKDENFPSHNTFRRFGRKAQLATRVLEYCREAGGQEEIIEICQPLAATATNTPAATETDNSEEFGYVYLLKSGRFYKIGRSNAVGRRERELALQLPEKVKTVHTIRTDDPSGIESYWHRRFADKRKNGEWFELSSRDVKAFRRRTFM